MKYPTTCYEEHAGSRYMCVTIGLIDALQRAHFAGRDLSDVAPHIDADKAAIIVAETLEADRVWNLPAAQLFGDKQDLAPMTDFKRAAIAEIIFETSKLAREEFDDHKKAKEWWALAMALLEYGQTWAQRSLLVW